MIATTTDMTRSWLTTLCLLLAGMGCQSENDAKEGEANQPPVEPTSEVPKEKESTVSADETESTEPAAETTNPSGASDGVWTRRERRWLDRKSANNFQALMEHLADQHPLGDEKATALEEALDAWPAHERVAPEAWAERVADGESVEMLEYVRVLAFDGGLDADALDALLDEPALERAVTEGPITGLDLRGNHFGDDGAERLAASELVGEDLDVLVCNLAVL
ncbi:MAG: hypothetical protein ABEN55_08440, partial [Bradymonadaceae bacterium]